MPKPLYGPGQNSAIGPANTKQGQVIKEGDLLVQIDPRPYQAALDQALAKKAQDEANLKNAQIDLQRYAYLAKKAIVYMIT